ncbi:hypothetical protein NDU88_008006 [Pleurodeles waltl]|uniref:Uncharacterized protein n=1 Tax=Pleurodeles waltl TaxID=8319 RepID=A0AAV7U421_PLEWA|nr:hypothetical protein NDU88_008006 [Pleurodeles waltl]
MAASQVRVRIPGRSAYKELERRELRASPMKSNAEAPRTQGMASRTPMKPIDSLFFCLSSHVARISAATCLRVKFPCRVALETKTLTYYATLPNFGNSSPRRRDAQRATRKGP